MKKGNIRHKKKSVPPHSEQALLREVVQQLRDRCCSTRAHCDKDFLAAFDWAVDLANTGKHEEAMAFIDELLLKYKKIPKSFRAHLYYLKGFTLHQNTSDNKRALLYYNKAISSSPTPEGVYYYDRGCLRESMGDKDGRRSDFEVGRKIYPIWFEEYEENQ
jgi:tetratricopeptide (TPR) repeat protein